MAAELPPQVQNQLRQLQEIQQQAQVVVQQRSQLELSVRELERAIEELGKLEKDTPVFRSAGALLVRVKDHAALKKDLDEQRETLDVRLQSAKRQEQRLRERLTSLQRELQAALGGPSSGAGPEG